MPRVTTKGQVTIPKEVREELGIEPGDEVRFEPSNGGFEIRKEAPTTESGSDPFEAHRGRAEGSDSMPDRMRRLRGEFPRDTEDRAESGDETSDEQTKDEP